MDGQSPVTPLMYYRFLGLDVRYEDIRENSFWGHLDVSRLSVPRYQNMFRILIWFAFLVVYSQAGKRLRPSIIHL